MATNPVKTSPTATIGALVTGTLTLLATLVAHGVIPAGFVKSYGAFVVIAVVAAAFLLTWLHVTPWAKVQQLAVQLEDGRIPDADLARIEAIVTDVVHGGPALAVGAAHPDAAPDAHPDAGAVEPTAGMSAGSPPA